MTPIYQPAVVADLFATDAKDTIDLAFAQKAVGEAYIGIDGKDRDELIRIAVNQEALVVYGWQPYLHDRRLRRRLHRVNVPTLVIWGSSDGVVGADYGRAFAESIPGARFVTIDGARHHPHLEQTDECRRVLAEFHAANRGASIPE